MDKIHVKICMGTACYVMGSGSFLFLKEMLEPEIAAVVEIEAVACCGGCDGIDAKPPYVYVNNTLIDNADRDGIAEAVKKAAIQKEQKEQRV